jgi:hypothetical protein
MASRIFFKHADLAIGPYHRAVTAGELREFLALLPDDTPILREYDGEEMPVGYITATLAAWCAAGLSSGSVVIY